MESFSIKGKALETATVKDIRKANENYEAECLRAAKKVGYGWTPTREMLIDHIAGSWDKDDRMRRGIKAAIIIGMLNSLGIVLLAWLLL